MRSERRPRTLTTPLIVTAHLEKAAFDALDGLRRRHFPTARNIVPAHITLFHALPDERMRSVLATIRAFCASTQSFVLSPRPPRFLGRGVAFAYASSELSALRSGLAREWNDWLTPQDKQRFVPHVTIQNKATPHEARALFETLSEARTPLCSVLGLDLWRYRGGPWEPVATCLFSDCLSEGARAY